MAFLYSFPEKHVSFRRCTLAQQVGQFVNPVLQALRRLGGSAKPAQVCDEVASDMGLEGTATLEEKLSTGASRFANKIAWVRFGLPQKKRALEKCGRVEATRSARDDEEAGW